MLGRMIVLVLIVAMANDAQVLKYSVPHGIGMHMQHLVFLCSSVYRRRLVAVP